MTVRVRAEVKLGAISRNVGRLRAAAPGAAVCAVVKADAYGHGMVAAAQAAQAGGASWLAVATAEEARALRASGASGRILILGALSDEETRVALDADADVVAWREGFVRRVAALGGARVHVKLDTGMGRLGTRDPVEATRVAEFAADRCELAGLMSHFATADDRGDDFFGGQLERFRTWAEPLSERFPGALRHVANSAATLREPRSHFDLVRVGIAIYGMDPFGEDPAMHQLEPALSLVSYVAEIKRCAPGESVGYGRRFVAASETTIATVPVGYGDGWRRALSSGCRRAGGRAAHAAGRDDQHGQPDDRPGSGRRRRADR